MSNQINQLLIGTTNQTSNLEFKQLESRISDYLYINPNNNQYHQHKYQQTYTIINHVGIYVDTDNDIDVDLISITEDNDANLIHQTSANFPLFLNHKNKIKIPSKVEFALRRYTPKPLLRDVHPNIEIAVELCLLFVSQLTSTYFDVLTEYNPEGWKALNSRYLRDLLSTDPMAYKKARIALEYPLKKGSILICDYLCNEGVNSYHYRLGDAYMLKGIKTYELKTPTAIKLLNKRFLRTYGLAITNPICKNLIELYPNITLPSKAEIIKEAKRLTKMGYKTKKGKRLTFLNKHSRSYFKNPEQLSFVEDAIQIFEYLTDNGLMVPNEGTEKSGGRVVDSFTLMPSWIRNLVKIDGKKFVEVDYSCLHPNIAMNKYGGKREFLTHNDVALEAGLELDSVKREHLSFFNKNFWQMKQSPLFDYYKANEPQMMERLLNEKKISPEKHRITSMKMFKIEVMIMEDVITKLNQEGIYVGYIYDALFCKPYQAERVREIMDSVVLKHGVKTRAKFSDITETIDQKSEQIASSNKTTSTLPLIYWEKVNFNIDVKNAVLDLIKQGKELVYSAVLIDFGDGDCIEEKVTIVYDEFNPEKKYMSYSFIFGS